MTVHDDGEELAREFETYRAHLRGVAYRILGSYSEADDAVQETWLRLSRADHAVVANLGGWLTTVVARVSLDLLRARKSRREELAGEVAEGVAGADPEAEAALADDVGLAMLVVLDTLAPAERLAFVLHDMFAVPFDDIATIVGRSPAAARQLASRGRRRVQGATVEPDVSRQREVVEAFLAAARGGDFQALLALLDPAVVFRADAAAVRAGSEPEARGPDAVAATFSGRAQVAQTALIDGYVGATWSAGGKVRVVFDFVVEDGRVVEIELLADPATLARLDVTTLG